MAIAGSPRNCCGRAGSEAHRLGDDGALDLRGAAADGGLHALGRKWSWISDLPLLTTMVISVIPEETSSRTVCS
ncbi:hypothetical protein, partial [Nocardia sp. NPDC003648]